MKAKKIIGRLLLAFVVVSICVAVGKEIVAARQALLTPSVGSDQDKVVVYYLHGTYRCPACNWIESAGEQFIQREYGTGVAPYRVEWLAMDYQQDDAFARRYEVAGNMIVVASFRCGRDIAVRRLTRVMELSGKAEEFEACLRKAVVEVLGEKP